MDHHEVGAGKTKRRTSYHHGNLREALIDVTIELISRDGVAGVSISEACRQLGVSPGAPYRHFADRGDLLTEIAVRGCEVLVDHISKVVGDVTDPVERMARATRAFVEFAAHHPPLFEVLLDRDVFLGGNVRLKEPVRPVVEAFLLPAFDLPGADAPLAINLAVACGAVAQGYAAFLPAGTFSDSPDAFALAADYAACATRALIMGRAALSSAAEPVALAGLTIGMWVDAVANRTKEAN